jgi:hypothetical protein
MGGKPFSTEVSERRTRAREDEESPLLETVAREGMVNTQKVRKFLARAVVICELWSVAVAL